MMLQPTELHTPGYSYNLFTIKNCIQRSSDDHWRCKDPQLSSINSPEKSLITYHPSEKDGKRSSECVCMCMCVNVSVCTPQGYISLKKNTHQVFTLL